MEQPCVTYEKRGRVAVITICNPPVNVLTNEVRDGLYECTKQAEADADVAVVIYTGSGEKAFMAGANIKGFPDMCGVPGAAYGYARTVYEVWDKIRSLSKPTIAAINGLALGAGLELALACDLRIASENAKFGLPEINLGLFPGGGGTQRLPRIAGMALAKEMIFTGDPIQWEKAFQTGLINDVVPRGEALNMALELADHIAEHSGAILALAKKALNGGVGVTDREGISVEAEFWQDCFMTEDIVEGVSAFLEKRKPVFHDK